jgi:DNA-directed RNA polymerase beta subunit
MNPQHRPQFQPSQLYLDLLSVCGLNPWDGYNSSSRKQMFASHIGQTLVVEGATERFWQTGMEREYGKYTFKVEMPCLAEVIKVVPRYRKTYDQNAIQHNPQTIIIYQDIESDSKEVGCLDLRDFYSHHQYLGFPYKQQPGMRNIHSRATVQKGTVLLDSPNVTEDGGYTPGVEVNVAMMTMDPTSEDGFIVCDDVLDKFVFRTYEGRVVEFGAKMFPVNVHGTVENPKFFLDVGDYVPESGIVMGLRRWNEDLAFANENIHAVTDIHYPFDKVFYAPPGGKIIDVKVHHDPIGNPGTTPEAFEKQALRYDNARRQFYSEIVLEWRRLQTEYREALQLSPQFGQLVEEAISVVGSHGQGFNPERIRKLHRKTPLDDWRIEFTIEYRIRPNEGNKITDTHGGKGVMVKVLPRRMMPRDSAGNVADMVIDPLARYSRMNLGGPIELYANASRRDMIKYIRELTGIQQGDPKAQMKLEAMERDEPAKFEAAWEHLMGFYRIVSPEQHQWHVSGAYEAAGGTRAYHLAYCIRKDVYIHAPPAIPRMWPDIAMDLEEHYPSTYGPVTFEDEEGVVHTTVEPVRIGSIYMLLLEKIADDWTAVSSGKLQLFGIPAQISAADKYARPTRVNSVRTWGEAEMRILVSYAGSLIAAETIDRSNNPITHEHILYNLLEADNPTNIERIVDRSKIPLGGAKPLQYIKHLLLCSGIEFVYTPYKSPWADHNPQMGSYASNAMQWSVVPNVPTIH